VKLPRRRFAEQFRHDLQVTIEQLQRGITVDAEITLLRYLQDNLEAHFDFFQDLRGAGAGRDRDLRSRERRRT
jgi:hypothetical protein